MRRNVTFQSQGLRCAGWLYLPDNIPAGRKVPAVVMADATCSVKEMVEGKYAETFAAAGIAALAFDFRFLGESEGEPRNSIIYYDQHEDLRNAITFLSDQPEIDGERIGIWGISNGGGHVLRVAAYDKRIKAAAAVVPLGLNYDAIEPLMGPQGMAQFMGFLTGDRIGRYHGRPSGYLALVSRGESQALFPNPAAYNYYMETAKKQAPNFRNQLTLESVEKNLEFDPGASIHLISPAALLMVTAEGDMAIPAGQFMAEAFKRAGEPKKLITLPCAHTDVFDNEPAFSQASDACANWFRQYLMA
jgi:fermentation-respiration switch protein FrsA (DUF1100 family)